MCRFVALVESSSSIGNSCCAGERKRGGEGLSPALVLGEGGILYCCLSANLGEEIGLEGSENDITEGLNEAILCFSLFVNTIGRRSK